MRRIYLPLVLTTIGLARCVGHTLGQMPATSILKTWSRCR